MRIDLVTWYYLAVMCGLVPWLAIKSGRHLAAGKPFPPRRKYFVEVLVMQAFFVALSLLVAREHEMALFPAPTFTAKPVLMAAVILALMAGTIPLRWRVASEVRRQRVRWLAPQGAGEMGWWVAVCLAAGIGEEITYRGVLFGVISGITGAWWPAALICAGVFGVAHVVQGRKTSALIFVFPWPCRDWCMFPARSIWPWPCTRCTT